MTILESRPVAADFILNEPSPQISRETGDLTGAEFHAGTVVSRAAATDPYGEADAAHTDFAVVYDYTDASAADKPSLLIVRLAALKDKHLIWPAAFAAADIDAVKAVLVTHNIVAR